MENIYVSLDEARAELKRRWSDDSLKNRAREALGTRLIPHYGDEPLFVSTRQLMTADNSAIFFAQCARYVGATPCAQEFLGDTFVHFNEEKKGLGRLRVELEDGTRATVDIMVFHENERTPLGNCILKDGSNLADFHHHLLALDGDNILLRDNTAWYRSIGKASDYYHDLLVHFVAHGVLFETFYDEGGTTEDAFTHEVAYPAITQIKKEFGLSPLIVRSFPETQSDDEDFYWWSHSPQINAYILTYARERNLELKPIK